MFLLFINLCVCMRGTLSLEYLGFVDYDQGAHDDLLIGVLIPFSCTVNLDSMSMSGYYYASALQIALEDAAANPTLLAGRRVSVVWNETCCMENHTLVNQMSQLRLSLKQLHVHAFVGPACYCSSSAMIAAALNIPIISYMCGDREVSNKFLYPTFARTLAMDSQLIPSLLSVLQFFKWKHVGVLSEREYRWQRLRDEIIETLLEHRMSVGVNLAIPQTYAYTPDEGGCIMDRMAKMLMQKARIIVFLGSMHLLREFLKAASFNNMTKGDYAFIAFELDWEEFKTRQAKPFQYFPSYYDTDPGDLVTTMEQFKSVIVLGTRLDHGDHYLSFLHRADRRKLQQPFQRYKLNDNVTDAAMEAMPVIGAFLYDAVYQYLIALNTTISQNGSELDGTRIIKNLISRPFESILGYQVSFDMNGDVGLNMSLYKFLIRNGSAALIPIADFKLDRRTEGESVIHSLLLRSDAVIQWPENRGPPNDEPLCGFENEYCIVPPEDGIPTWSIATLMSIVLSALIFVAVYKYRTHRIRQELLCELWMIKRGDLFFLDCPGSGSSSLRNLAVWEPMISHESSFLHYFTSVANYRGNLVAIKRLNRRTVEMNAAILLELKLMKKTVHPNLNVFIGACVEPDNIMIISQYGTRGSLQDFLPNKNFSFKTPFLLSLIHDIVEGMAYLHSSDIKFSGNLKSSNCIVDCRWVVKITDYGLWQFKGGPKHVSNKMPHMQLHDQLYIAPELLRLPNHLGYGTQKGDIYSFSIILQEFHTRNGPWAHSNLDPQEILQRIIYVQEPPFRPLVQELLQNAERLRDVMKMCWSENPDDRCSFEDIRKILVELMVQNNMRTSVLDNMIYMMEQYSDNLEMMIEQRTLELIEEKFKTDVLLESMLPPLVAHHLKNGRQHPPEYFEHVTVCFSRIIDFNDFCSQNSPMQVVDYLNKFYTRFDHIICCYDVFKVETLGDDSLVVSGLPTAIDCHAEEIALMALDIQASTRRLESSPLVRIGINSGPVVAGVIGTSMPRYCLFGDTINTASRIESSGKASQIHISKSTESLLEASGHFIIKERGLVKMKGKGEVMTYWLLGTKKGTDILPVDPVSNGPRNSVVPRLLPNVRAFQQSSQTGQSTFYH